MATADGMNRFSASIILCQVSLSDFLDIKPEERIARFGEYIGVDSVVRGSKISELFLILLTSACLLQFRRNSILTWKVGIRPWK